MKLIIRLYVMDKNTPLPSVPAKMLESLKANEYTLLLVESPVLTGVQLAPLLMDKYTPSSELAKTLEPWTAIDKINAFAGKPLLAAIQVAPLLFDK